MRYLAFLLFTLTLTSSTFNDAENVQFLQNGKWNLSQSMNGYFTFSKQKDKSFSNSTLNFKENGVLVEKSEKNTSEPFSVSEYSFMNSNRKLLVSIQNSREWNGVFEITKLNHHHLTLVKLK